MGNDKRWIHLNLGGTYFSTSRSNFTKGTPPNSPLHRIAVNSTNIDWDRDEKGAFMIDRDPVYFQCILNYLRHGRLILHKNIPEEAILIEAEYFNIPKLMKLLHEMILNRNQQLQQQQLQQLQQQKQLRQQQDYEFKFFGSSLGCRDQLASYVNCILDSKEV